MQQKIYIFIKISFSLPYYKFLAPTIECLYRNNLTKTFAKSLIHPPTTFWGQDIQSNKKRELPNFECTVA